MRRTKAYCPDTSFLISLLDENDGNHEKAIDEIKNIKVRVSIEGVIKELKIGIGLEDIPTGDYYANSLFFAIGVLVYNTTVIMKEHLLPEEYGTKTIETIRWSIVNIAGRLVNHGRRLVLLLASTIDKLLLYERMRDSCFIFA